jgi:probable F420-dependent oxidoreductase
VTPPRRLGVTVPVAGRPLLEQRQVLEEIERLGYSDVWSSESNGPDAFTPLALASAWTPGLRLGTAIASVFTRGPALLAQQAAALAEAAPGRFALGIGASSPAIVGDWNGITYEKPLARVRDTARFLRQALAGEKVNGTFDTFQARGFRLARPPQVPPPILIAALRPPMLRLAAAEGDGVILNWLSAADVAQAVGELGTERERMEVVCRVMVCPDADATEVRESVRQLFAGYLSVGAYAAFQEWLGRGPALTPMWEAWRSGDRAGAARAVPDEVIDQLVVHGGAATCRRRLDEFYENGVTTLVIAMLPKADLAAALSALAPVRTAAR